MNFEKQKSYQKEKYDKYKLLADKTVDSYLNCQGIYISDIMDMAEKNNDEFKKVCMGFASTLMPGAVKCTAYACAAASLLNYCGLNDYTVHAGFCLPRSNQSFSATKSKFEAERANGVVHPFMITHVFVKFGENIYECYEGETENIEHFDTVAM